MTYSLDDSAYPSNESGMYPPGTEFDPKAPWNQDPDDIDNLEFEHDMFCSSNLMPPKPCDCRRIY